MDILYSIFVFIFGIVIGSFLNVVIIRESKNEKITGRSHCTKCEYKLKWYDNIPIISYLILGGRCRNCGEKISIQYPIIELLNGILWVVIYNFYGLSIKTLVYCIITSIMIIISFEDAKTQEINPIYIYTIIILGIILMLVNKSFRDSISGAFAVSLFLIVVLLITNGKGIGGGDVKLMFALGLNLGLKSVVISFYIGCILAVIVHITLIKLNIKGIDKHRLAFGPYLCIGGYISMLYGIQLADFMINLIF